MRNATAKKALSRGFIGKKTKYYNVLTIIANSLLPPPPVSNLEIYLEKLIKPYVC